MKRRNFFYSLFGGLAAGSYLTTAKSSPIIESLTQNLPNLNKAGTGENYWNLVRKWFPLREKKTYFNTGGLGPSNYAVLETFFQETMRLETIGEHDHRRVYEVTQKAANFLGANPDEIGLTRNTTEGMNIIARGLPLKQGDEILMSTHEHVGGTIPWLALSNDIGVKINLFEPAPTAAENLNIIESKFTPKTKVLSLSHVTCTCGLKFPVKEIAQLCRDRQIIFVLDGAHPPGMFRINLHEIGCDLYATSGHKWLMGPKGTGILYVSQRMMDIWKPTYVGAYSEDGSYDLNAKHLVIKKKANSVEYGTRNTPLYLALGAAMDFVNSIGQERIAQRGLSMSDYFRTKLMNELPEVEILTPSEKDLYCSIITFRSHKMDAIDLQRAISRKHYTRVRNVSENGLNAVRCSFHVYNNFQEIDQMIEIMKDILR